MTNDPPRRGEREKEKGQRNLPAVGPFAFLLFPCRLKRGLVPTDQGKVNGSWVRSVASGAGHGLREALVFLGFHVAEFARIPVPHPRNSGEFRYGVGKPCPAPGGLDGRARSCEPLLPKGESLPFSSNLAHASPVADCVFCRPKIGTSRKKSQSLQVVTAITE